MKSTLNRLLPVVLAIGAVPAAAAQGPARQNDAISSIATLFARDPLMQSLCFKDGGPGAVFQNGQRRNRCSDLNFNSYSMNALSVGVEGGRQGTILDLGTPEDLKSKYGTRRPSAADRVSPPSTSRMARRSFSKTTGPARSRNWPSPPTCFVRRAPGRLPPSNSAMCT